MISYHIGKFIFFFIVVLFIELLIPKSVWDVSFTVKVILAAGNALGSTIIYWDK